MNKTFKSEISASTPMEYDVSTLLNINEGKVSLVGITVIALIPIAVLGTGLVNIYMRKKRVNETV